jgi:hypothetical protein
MKRIPVWPEFFSRARTQGFLYCLGCAGETSRKELHLRPAAGYSLPKVSNSQSMNTPTSGRARAGCSYTT